MFIRCFIYSPTIANYCWIGEEKASEIYISRFYLFDPNLQQMVQVKSRHQTKSNTTQVNTVDLHYLDGCSYYPIASISIIIYSSI